MSSHKCPTCDRDDFAREVDMKAHHTLAHGESLVGRENKLKCPMCNEYFASEMGMKVHHAQVHDESIAGSRAVTKTIRERVLERDDHRCQRCDAAVGSTASDFELHHLLPVAAGGPDHVDNLITLCSECHGEVHRELKTINDDHPALLDDLRAMIADDSRKKERGFLSSKLNFGGGLLSSFRSDDG